MLNFKSSGFDKGTGWKSGKFQFNCDGCILFTRRSINTLTNSFSFSLYKNTICLFILFFAAQLSLILQGLILLYRSLRFSDRNSIIDYNFGNTFATLNFPNFFYKRNRFNYKQWVFRQWQASMRCGKGDTRLWICVNFACVKKLKNYTNQKFNRSLRKRYQFPSSFLKYNEEG